jgi:hypothetical protein
MAELIIFVICAALSIAASIYRLQLPADEQQSLISAEMWQWNIPI